MFWYAFNCNILNRRKRPEIYQLVLRNVDSFEEKVSYRFRYSTIVVLFVAILMVNFAVALWLAKNVLDKWMNPCYQEKQNQKQLVEAMSKLETLEKQADINDQYCNTIRDIVSYKISPSSPTKEQPSTGPLNDPEESTTDQRASSQDTWQKYPRNTCLELWMPPIQGIVTNKFNKQQSHYGIDIVAKDRTPIKAITRGTVLLADWSVETGWVIAIQHYSNEISIYKHCAVLFKKVGDTVQVGDVIALMGNSGSMSTGSHLHFELWGHGVAQDPEDFISFD